MLLFFLLAFIGSALFLHFAIINIIAPSVWLSIWTSINIVVGAYLYFITLHRQRLSRSYCLNPYISVWNRNDLTFYKKDLWLQLWTDYACIFDSRMLVPNSLVYVLLTVNVLIVCATVIVMVMKLNKSYVYNLILIQFVNTCLYVGTLLLHYLKTKDKQISLKKAGYACLPLLWIVIPVVIYLRK